MLKAMAVAGVLLASSAAAQDPPEERIYGRVTTAGGDLLEGWLRWDHNEASWSDFLDGQKEIPWEHLRDAELLDPEYAEEQRRERSIEAFGVRITWDRDDDDPRTVSSAVRFGDIDVIRVLDGRRARLLLKSGEEVVLRSSSSDLGRSMRGLVVEDRREGEVELRWIDLDEVAFGPAPSDAGRPRAERLHGTVRTRSGLELTGVVSWDRDEALTTDILDGEDVEDQRDYEIAFREISAIEYDSRRSARVVLRDGTERILRGTNDVDDDNRGIEVSDPALGRAIVPWEEFESLTLHPDRAMVGSYGAFDGGVPLRATVTASSGEQHTGRIRWDNDEAASWEVIDGWSGDIEYDIELRHVLEIGRANGYSVELTLLDGRVLELEGSNDVDRGNQGIFITPNAGPMALVKWEDLERVVFEW